MAFLTHLGELQATKASRRRQSETDHVQPTALWHRVPSNWMPQLVGAADVSTAVTLQAPVDQKHHLSALIALDDKLAIADSRARQELAIAALGTNPPLASSTSTSTSTSTATNDSACISSA